MPRKMSVGVKTAIIAAVATVVAAAIGVLGTPSTETPKDALPPSRVEDIPGQIRTPIALEALCAPSGWMGDGQNGRTYLNLEQVQADVNGSIKTAIHFDYKAGPAKWAGVYWQCPDGNWGGVRGVSLEGARAITFLAKGDSGNEIVEFKSGGIRGTFPDSFEVSLGQVSLTRSWKEYRIDLSGRDLSNVAGAFAWSAPAPASGRLSFSLTSIELQ